jgi:hypothetical protein
MQAKPSMVIPVAKQITCRGFDGGKSLEQNIRTEMPSINIDALLARR